MKLRLLIVLFCSILSYNFGTAQSFDDYQKTWATYFGGSGIQFFYSAADSDGNIIAVGQLAYLNFTNGDADYYNQFITTDDPQFQYHPDVFFQTIIAKFSPDGDLLWSGYYPFNTVSFGIDAEDNIYLAAMTKDPTLGTTGAWEEQPLDDLANSTTYSIMVKLNADFTLDWLTYLPINTYLLMDIGRTGVFCTGGTPVEQGITTDNVFQSDYLAGGANGYIVKLDFQGQLVWGTYTGITGNLSIGYSGYGLVVFSSKREAGNDDYYITDDAYQQTPSSRIISIFDSYTGERTYGTYFDDNIGITSIRYSNDGFIYMFGQANGSVTDSALISDDAFQTSVEDTYNYYLGKFDAQMNPIWGTYIGGNQPEMVFLSNFSALTVKYGSIYISSTSQSNDFFDSPNPYQSTNNGNKDLIIMKFSLNGDLVWGSFFGGPETENTGSIVPTSDDTFYLVGTTSSSSDISTPGVYQENLNKYPDASPYFSYSNGFVAKFSPGSFSINNFEMENIKVYPNPTDGTVFINGNFSGQRNIILYNLLGQEVFSKKMMQSTNAPLDLHSLSPGVYFLKIVDPKGNNSLVKKLIIN